MKLHRTHKLNWSACLLFASMGLSALSAQAGLVSTRFGAQDGFGVGIAAGATFFPDELVAGRGDGTDEWRSGGFSTNLLSNWSGNLTGARLEVFSGGWGLDGATEVWFNNHLIGLLTIADGDTLGDNYAVLDGFNMNPYLGLITGHDSVELRTVNADDAGVLGFLRLTLQTDAGGNTVPEPATLGLVGAALAACLIGRRRRL